MTFSQEEWFPVRLRRLGAAPVPAGALAVFLALGLVTAGCSRDAKGGDGGERDPQAEGGEKKKEEPAIAVAVTPAERRAMAGYYASSATLRSERRATVTARTSGVVERLAVEEGDAVAEGTPLAWLEDDEQRLALEKARAGVAVERREHERATRLHERGLLATEAYELGRQELEDAETALAEAELALSRTVLRAPFAGRVLARHLDVGATVSSGTEVYDVADLDPLQADVSVPERHVAKLAVGQSVKLATDSTDETFDGRIERIAPSVNAETGTVKVTVAVEESAGLRPGSFVRVAVVTETRPDALVVPASALVADGRQWVVFRLAEDGEHVERVPVERGLEEDDVIEVLPDETPVKPAKPRTGTTVTVEGDATSDEAPPAAPRVLEAGDAVVTSGAAALSDGARVALPETEGESARGLARADRSASGELS